MAPRQPQHGVACVAHKIMPNTEAKGQSSVILIREWERQMSASGCCGRLEGDFLQRRGERCFPERRAVMEAMGPLYRDLRSRYGNEVEIHVVDPRNLFTIFAHLYSVMHVLTV